jgi:hypothetical protein
MCAFGGSSREKLFSSYESIDGKLSEIQKKLGQQQDALTGTLAVDIQQLHAKIDYMYAQVTRLVEHTYVEPVNPPRESKSSRSEGFDPKLLAKLSQLDNLDRLESLSKLSALSKLDDLDNLAKLDKLDKLDSLDSLKQLENLGYLKRLDLLNEIKLSIPSIVAQSSKTPAKESVQNLIDMDSINDSLKKLTVLDRIDRAQQIMLAKMGTSQVQNRNVIDDSRLSEMSSRFVELVSVYREQNKVLRMQNEALQEQLKEFSNDLKLIKNSILQGQKEPVKKKAPKSQL